MSGRQDEFTHLDPAGRVTGTVAQQPRLTVYGLLGTGIALSWLVIGAMAVRGAASRTPGADAPGDPLLQAMPFFTLPEPIERFFALCLTPAPLGEFGLSGFLALSAMWFVMAVAMMLPSAAPMIRTYCEIADTAGTKGDVVVHPLVLVAGYLSVWLAAALAFAGLTAGLYALASTQPLDPTGGIAGAAALAIAGLYQFSGLKEACLEKCRNPFAILFANWSVSPVGIFRLGGEQGLWCLGCCWALMLVMFVVGTMNIFWMALMALFTIVEKRTNYPLATRVAGALLLVWALALLLISGLSA